MVFCFRQWRCHRAFFVVYRLMMSAYSIFAFTHMVVLFQQQSDRTHNIMVFLTTWTYLLETVFFAMGAVLALLHCSCPRQFFTRGRHSERRPKLELGQKPASYRSGVENSGYEGVAVAEKNGISPSYNVPPRCWEGSSRTQEGLPAKHNESGASPTEKSDRRSEDAERSRKAHLMEACPTAEAPQPEPPSSPESATLGNESALPWYIQVYWALCNAIQVFAIVVTVIYFSALYPTMGARDGGVSLSDLNVHGLNSVMVLIDIAVCARPVRLLHGLYPFLYGSAYVVFSVVYWSRDRERNVLYENVLDWNQPGITLGVVFGMTLVGIPLLQLANFGVYQLRLGLYRKMYGEQYL